MPEKKPALFLDRDGVIIKNVPYSNEVESVSLMDGIAELICEALRLNYWVIVVTNQSGIGRGWVRLESYEAITERMEFLLQQKKAKLHRIYFAPYYDQAADLRWRQQPDWRKPEPGMFNQACLDYPIDLANSLMIGDRASDLLAAEKAGVARKILLSSEDCSDEIKLVPAGIKFEFHSKPGPHLLTP